MVSEDILKILICPVCRGRVRAEPDKIVCVSCGRIYPVVDGVPVMLADEARLEPK